METNLCRKGVWHVGPLQLALPIDGSDTLGLLRVAGPSLTLFDLDVMAWLTERWREGDRSPRGELHLTLYELGRDLYGHEPSGKDHRTMHASLRRLQDVLFELEGYDARAAHMGRLESPTEKGRIRLVADLIWSTSAEDTRERHVVFLGPWLVKQLEAGYLTYLHWRILRGLDGSPLMRLAIVRPRFARWGVRPVGENPAYGELLARHSRVNPPVPTEPVDDLEWRT